MEGKYQMKSIGKNTDHLQHLASQNSQNTTMLSSYKESSRPKTRIDTTTLMNQKTHCENKNMAVHNKNSSYFISFNGSNIISPIDTQNKMMHNFTKSSANLQQPNTTNRSENNVGDKLYGHNNENRQKQDKTQKRTKTGCTFPLILYEMVHTVAVEHPHLVRWIQNGEAFVVEEKHPCLKAIIKQYFNHSKYSSLQRQLNLYGFKKHLTGRYKGAFHHPMFRYSSLETLHSITRCPPAAERDRNKINKEQKSNKNSLHPFEDNVTNSQKCISRKDSNNIQNETTINKKKKFDDVKPVTAYMKKAQPTFKNDSSYSCDTAYDKKRGTHFDDIVTDKKRCISTKDSSNIYRSKNEDEVATPSLVAISNDVRSVTAILKTKKVKTTFSYDSSHSCDIADNKKCVGNKDSKHVNGSNIKALTKPTAEIAINVASVSVTNDLHKSVNKKEDLIQEVEMQDASTASTPAVSAGSTSNEGEEQDMFYLTPLLLKEERYYDGDDDGSSFRKTSNNKHFKLLPSLDHWSPLIKDENEKLLDFLELPLFKDKTTTSTVDKYNKHRDEFTMWNSSNFLELSLVTDKTTTSTVDKCNEHHDEFTTWNRSNCTSAKNYPSFNLSSFYQEQDDDFLHNISSLEPLSFIKGDHNNKSMKNNNTSVNINTAITKTSSNYNNNHFLSTSGSSKMVASFTVTPTSLVTLLPKYINIQISPLVSSKIKVVGI